MTVIVVSMTVIVVSVIVVSCPGSEIRVSPPSDTETQRTRCLQRWSCNTSQTHLLAEEERSLLQSCHDITKQPSMAIWIFWKKPQGKIWTPRMRMAWHPLSGQLTTDTSKLCSSYAVEGELRKPVFYVQNFLYWSCSLTISLIIELSLG